jgi:hypothetical protein
LTHGAALTQTVTLFTVVETQIFTRLWPDYWDEDERGEFDIDAATLDRIRRTLDGEDD